MEYSVKRGDLISKNSIISELGRRWTSQRYRTFSAFRELEKNNLGSVVSWTPLEKSVSRKKVSHVAEKASKMRLKRNPGFDSKEGHSTERVEPKSDIKRSWRVLWKWRMKGVWPSPCYTRSDGLLNTPRCCLFLWLCGIFTPLLSSVISSFMKVQLRWDLSYKTH